MITTFKICYDPSTNVIQENMISTEMASAETMPAKRPRGRPPGSGMKPPQSGMQERRPRGSYATPKQKLQDFNEFKYELGGWVNGLSPGETVLVGIPEEIDENLILNIWRNNNIARIEGYKETTRIIALTKK